MRKNATLPDELDLPEAGDESMSLGAPVDDERPSRAPGPQRRPMVADMDRDDERLARLRRQRAQQMRAMADNPFLNEEAVGLPPLPDDDPEWAYAWKRHSLPAASATENRQVDTKNLQIAVHGRLPYEFVSIDMLPPAWRDKMRTFAVLEGKHEGKLVYNDLIAARTQRHLRNQKVAADNYRAAELRKSLKSDLAADMRAQGFSPYVEDRETVIHGDDYPRASET